MKPHIPALLVELILITILALFVVNGPTVTAQQVATVPATGAATCSDFVKQALTIMDQACANTGRNQACYGSISIKASPQPGVSNFQFSQPGNIVNLSDIQTLELSALKADENAWGVALMRLQANLPGTTAGQFVTMLLFGDVKIQNEVIPPTTTLPITISTATSVRRAPVNGTTLIDLAANDTVTATGRLKDGTWLRVQLPGKDSPIVGWISIKTIPANVNVDSLDVIDPAAPVYAPMQAFYFQTGVGAQSCQSAPPNGILIQTPKNAPKVTMMINDAKLTIGSSAFINSDTDMTISTFDGSVTVEAQGQQAVVPAGLQVTLPLAANGRVNGPPAQPVTFNAQDFQNLIAPLQHLPIQVAPSLSATRSATTQPVSQKSTPSLVCPPGSPHRISSPAMSVNGVAVPATNYVTPCTCSNGSHLITVAGGAGVTITEEICN